MRPHTDSNRRPARLVYGAVLILLTLLVSVVIIKHFDGQADQPMPASAGPAGAGDPASDLTHSGVPHGPAANAPSVASAASAASAATEPPNPFKAFLDGNAAAPVAKTTPPPAAAPAQGTAASAASDPFKAFLDSGQASAAAAPAATAPATDAQAPVADPFKEALERQQQQQPH